MESEPPCAEEAETAVLTIAFNNPERYIPRLRSSGATVETFWKWKRLASEIFRFYDENGTLETISFRQDLLTRGTWEGCGGVEVFDIIAPTIIPAKGWTKWVEQIQEAHALRIAYQLHQGDNSYDSSEKAQEALQEALEAIKKAKSGPSRAISAAEAGQSFLEQFKANRQAGDIPGKSTGVIELDALCGGMRPGELWVICGETSRGKSVLMLQLAAEVITTGGKVAIFSLEMSKEEIIARLACFVGRMDFTMIMQPRLMKSSRDLEKLTNTVISLQESVFWIDDSADQSVDHISSEVGHLVDEFGGLDMILVDYLQLVDGSRVKGETREQEISNCSKSLKQLAKRTQCPVVTGSQLNEFGRTRESRAITHDASSVLFIADDGVKVGKMRNGKKDVIIPLYLNGQYQRFTPVKPQP